VLPHLWSVHSNLEVVGSDWLGLEMEMTTIDGIINKPEGDIDQDDLTEIESEYQRDSTTARLCREIRYLLDQIQDAKYEAMERDRS
jgi:hypothetical protein